MNETSTCDTSSSAGLRQGIFHKGIISKLDTATVLVRLSGPGGCGHCAASGSCASAQKVQEFKLRREGFMSLGQEVELHLEGRKDLMAVGLLLGVPVLLMVLGYFTFSLSGLDDVQAALASLGLVALWYGIIRLFRTSLEDRFAYVVRPLQSEADNRKDIHEY